MEPLLITHIAGAVFTVFFAIVSVTALVKKAGNLKLLRHGILALGVFQIITGAVLIALTPEISLARICVVSLAYLGAVFGIELALRRRIILAETLANKIEK